MINENVGGKDRMTRWIIGAGLVLFGLGSTGWKRWLSLTAASSLLGTAATQKCLFNKILGLNSCETNEI